MDAVGGTSRGLAGHRAEEPGTGGLASYGIDDPSGILSDGAPSLLHRHYPPTRPRSAVEARP